MMTDSGAADAVAAGDVGSGVDPDDTRIGGTDARPGGVRKSYDWLAIQHAYEETDLTIAQIKAVFGPSRSALYRRIVRECWKRRREPFVRGGDVPRQSEPAAGNTSDLSIPTKRPGLPTSTAGLRSFRKGMIVRLYEAMDRQLIDIEQQQIGGQRLSGADRERQTRQMNVMTRSMEKFPDVVGDVHYSTVDGIADRWSVRWSGCQCRDD